MARTFWSGHITFGLVTVPIKLATAVREKSIGFHMLSPDGTCRLRRKLYCPETGKEYDFNQTARGYEIAPDQYVIVNEKELDALKPEAGRAIEIAQFADIDEIDPIFFGNTYYLVPGEAGAKPYRLLMEAMKRSRRVAIARFVMREKQHVAVVRVRDDAMVLHTMHYADEVLSAKDAGADTEHVKLDAKETKMAEQLVEALTEPFDASKYKDEFREKVEEMVKRKAEGEQVTTAVTEEEPPRVINLAEALRKSLAQRHKAEREPRAHAPRRRKAG